MAKNATKIIAIGAHSERAAAISDAVLRGLTGASVFARGQTYACGDSVQDADLSFSDDEQTISLQATVQGTQPYSVDVVLTENDAVAGDCDCPHAQEGYFCKHQVALALVLRGMLGGDAPAIDPVAQKKVAASAKRAKTQASNRASLQNFVNQQSAAYLAQRLWDWAELDRNLMADLKGWAAQAQAMGDPKSLTKAITELLRSNREFLDWRECAAYVHRAGKVLPLLQPWLQKDPVQLRELCDHALRRLFKVAEQADDSNGEIGDLMHGVMDLMLAALKAQPPEAAWLDRFFALQQADPWGLWSERAVIDAAGAAVQAAFAKRAVTDWQAWQANKCTAQADASAVKGALRKRSELVVSSWGAERYDPERQKLRQRYLDCIERQDDPLAMMEAMHSSAQDAGEFSQLVEYCEKHRKLREAMGYALEAYKKFPKDGRAEANVLRCYERDGWDEEALVIRRRQLEARPDVEHFRAALKSAQNAGRDVASYRAELFAWAQAQELKVRAAPSWSRQAGPAGERDVSIRVRWLLADKQLDEALALVQAPHRCDAKLLREIAAKLPASRNQEALPLLLRAFEFAMPSASTPYTDVLEIVKEAIVRMEPLPRAQWLASLGAQYKAKRNFIKGLDARCA
jgi:hypothetical protein